MEKLDAMLSQPTIYHVLRVEHDPLMRPIRDTESFRALMEKHRTIAF